MGKFLVSNAPYLRNADYKHDTSTVMRDVLIALAPATLFGLYKNVIKVLINGVYSNFYQAIYPLLTLIISPIFSLLLEALCLYVMKKKEIKSFKDLWEEVKIGYGYFPGLFIVLISPTYIPLWILLLSITVGEVVGKMLFGGFGQNIFNPALIGRAFMAFSFSSQVSASYLTPLEASIDAYAGATPLIQYSKVASVTLENVVGNFGSLFDMLLGTYPGAFAETSALAIIIGGIYLIVRKVIDWRIPVIYVSTVFVSTMLSGFIMGQGLWFPLFQVLSGGLMFGAFFMATEPVTSPKTKLGRVMYALMLGALTVLFRLIGNMPEGVATSIITMNIFGLVIDRYAIKVRVNGKLDKNEVPGLVIFSIIFLALFVYGVIFACK